MFVLMVTMKTVSYSYYENGSLQCIQDSASNNYYRHYNTMGWLNQVNDNSTYDAGIIYNEFEYDELGNIEKINHGQDGAEGYTEYTYESEIFFPIVVENKIEMLIDKLFN